MDKDLKTRQASTDGDMQCLDVSSITHEHTKQNNGHAEKQKGNGTSPNDSINPLLSLLKEKNENLHPHKGLFEGIAFFSFFLFFFEGVSNNTSNGK